MNERIFLAFPVSAEAARSARDIQGELQKRNPGARIRWTNPDSMHVTLAFFGDVSRDVRETIADMVADVPRPGSFSVSFDRLGAFPNAQHPAVLAVLLKDEQGMATKLADALRAHVASVISLEDRPWKPHLTLGRNKGNARMKGLEEISIPKISWDVSEMVLYKSDLGTNGPKYTPLNQYSLV